MSEPTNDKQQQTVLAFRVAGVLLTGIGLVLLISGFVGFASSAGSADSEGIPGSFWTFAAGMLPFAVGAFCLRVGFFGAAVRFAGREASPVIRRVLEDARGDAGPAPTARPGRFCVSCGAPRGSDDRFCAGCGSALGAS